MLYEADFFRKSEQEDVRHVSERYIAKSDPFIVMVSTPYAPDGLFDSIEKEPEESCIYKRILLDYTYGLDKIYTREEIEKAKVSPSFERGCWSLCVSDRIIFGPNRCLLSSCDSRRGDAYHQSFHIDAECNESQAKELRLYCWNTGSIWQHIPINSGIHGLWLQEEAGTASKGGSHLNVRSQSDIVFGFGWHLFMAYYQFSAKVSGCTGEPESRTAGIRRGGSRGCTSTERISKCGKIQLCKSSDNIRRGELS